MPSFFAYPHCVQLPDSCLRCFIATFVAILYSFFGSYVRQAILFSCSVFCYCTLPILLMLLSLQYTNKEFWQKPYTMIFKVNDSFPVTLLHTSCCASHVERLHAGTRPPYLLHCVRHHRLRQLITHLPLFFVLKLRFSIFTLLLTLVTRCHVMPLSDGQIQCHFECTWPLVSFAGCHIKRFSDTCCRIHLHASALVKIISRLQSV